MQLSELLKVLRKIEQDNTKYGKVGDVDIDISIDISTGETDSDRRVFVNEFLEYQKNSDGWYSLLFSGNVNDRK